MIRGHNTRCVGDIAHCESLDSCASVGRRDDDTSSQSDRIGRPKRQLVMLRLLNRSRKFLIVKIRYILDWRLVDCCWAELSALARFLSPSHRVELYNYVDCRCLSSLLHILARLLFIPVASVNTVGGKGVDDWRFLSDGTAMKIIIISSADYNPDYPMCLSSVNRLPVQSVLT